MAECSKTILTPAFSKYTSGRKELEAAMDYGPSTIDYFLIFALPKTEFKQKRSFGELTGQKPG